MGQFLSAAYKVLKSEGIPLSAKELTEKALSLGILTSSGLTPHQTMKSKISTNILKYKNKSLFKRSSAGKFALAEWIDHKEYTAPRHVKALFDEDILVINRQCLSNLINNEGFLPASGDLSELMKVLFPLVFMVRRREAESNTELIQLVSVYIVHYKEHILTHKRTKRLPESRLHDYYSIAFGGHLTEHDYSPLLGQIDTNREISEELKFKSNPQIDYKGLIYDSSREVSRIHLGIIFDVHLTDMEFEIGERGYLIDAKFETLDEIIARINDFENWSQLLINTKENLCQQEQ